MQDLRSFFIGPPLLTLAVAESLTCGRVQAAIGAISGASAFFLGGTTAYSLEQKVRLLGVERAIAATCDSVSAEVAAQMAAGACRVFGSDVGVGTTGYAEPNPPAGVPHPMAYWAICYGGDTVRQGRLERPGLGRVEMQEAVVTEVIAALMEWIAAIRGGVYPERLKS